MKKLDIIFCSFFVIYIILIVFAESYSQPNCYCNRRMCRYTFCRCGMYRDYCNCCPVCYKCPGERCSFVAMDKCAGGTRCRGLQDASPVAYNNDGQCL